MDANQDIQLRIDAKEALIKKYQLSISKTEELIASAQNSENPNSAAAIVQYGRSKEVDEANLLELVTQVACLKRERNGYFFCQFL